MIYEVTVLQDYYGQQVLNRYNYLSSGTFVGSTGAAALLFALGLIPSGADFPTDSLYGLIQNNTVTALTYVQALSKAIREAPTDFLDVGYAAGVIGQGVGTQPMSPALGLGFRTNRTRTDIARGTKRLAGIDETFVELGGRLVSAAQTVANNIAEALTEVLSYTEDGSSATFAPIVVGKEKYAVPDTDRFAYKYYDTVSEQMDHIAEGVTWQAYDTIRTQTSRQYGHGA
jgi:hypothetical protein